MLGLAFPLTVAGSTQNVSMTELVISPASDWSIVDGDILATNTPGASVTYVCRRKSKKEKNQLKSKKNSDLIF